MGGAKQLPFDGEVIEKLLYYLLIHQYDPKCILPKPLPHSGFHLMVLKGILQVLTIGNSPETTKGDQELEFLRDLSIETLANLMKLAILVKLQALVELLAGRIAWMVRGSHFGIILREDMEICCQNL